MMPLFRSAGLAVLASCVSFVTFADSQWYAKPDGADGADCTDPATAGSIAAAMAKAAAADGASVIELADGDYDIASLTPVTENSSTAFFVVKKDLSLVSAGGAGFATAVSRCVFAANRNTSTRTDNTGAAVATGGGFTYYATNCIWNASGRDTCLDGTGNNTTLANDAAIGFVGGTGDDPYAIGKSSPARNTGVNVRGYTRKDPDLAGRRRLCEDLLDIGCYEYNPVMGLILLLR